jgi:DNA-binding NarL/FixJ family response regulator
VSKIPALICDDHPIVRSGLQAILAAAGDIEVAGCAAGFADLVQRLREAPCRVLLLDMEMPGKHGMEILPMVRREFPHVQVLVLSIYPEDQYAVRAFRAGACGYLNKNSAPERLVEAVRTVAAGRRFVSPEVSELLAQAVAADHERAPHELLSDREFQVLRLIVAGRRLSEIAAELSLSPKTVSVYRARIMEKMQLGSNVELARYAEKNNLL